MFRLESSVSVPDYTNPGLCLLIRSSAHPGFALPVPSPCEVSSSSLVRGYSRLGSNLPATGLFCAGSVSSPFVTEMAVLDSSLLLRSRGRLGSSLPVLRSVRCGFSLLLRGPARPSSPALLLGMARADFLSSLFVVDVANMAPSPFIRSLARFEPSLLAPQSSLLNSSVLVRQYTRSEVTVLASGLSWLGASSLASGEAKLGLLPFSHSSAHTEAAMLVSGFSHVGLLLSSRSLGCLGLPVPLYGLMRAGLVSSPPVVATAQPGPPLLPQSLACPDFFASVLGVAQTGFSLPSRGCAHVEPETPVPDYLHLDLSPPSRSSLQLDFFMSVLGKAASGSFSSTSDCSSLSASLSLRSSGRLGSSVLVSRFTSVDSSVSTRAVAHLGLSAPVVGMARVGFVFFMLVLDLLNLDPFLPVRVSAHPGPPAFIMNYARLELLMLLRSFAHGELALPVFGLVWADPVFSLPVVSTASLGSSPLVRSFVCFEASASCYDYSAIGSAVSMRNSARLGFLMPAFGGVRSDPPPLLLDYAQIGLPMPARSFCKTESSVPTLAFGSPGFVMSPRALSQLGLAASPVGLSRVGSVFFLSVVAAANLGLPLSVQSPARPGSGMPAVRCAAVGSPSLLRHHARPEAFASTVGLARAGFVFSLPAISHGLLGPLMSLRSTGRSGLLAFAMGSVHSDFSTSFRSMARLGFATPTHDMETVDLTLPSQGSARSGFASPVLGLGRTGPCFSLPVADASWPGFTTSTRCGYSDGIGLGTKGQQQILGLPGGPCVMRA